MEKLIIQLFEIEAVKFGSFTLKSGISCPVYFDLRVIISFPNIMKLVSDHMWQRLEKAGCQYKSVCGVAYTALPIATCISASHNIPMLIRRKETKDYGTKKLIEGRYSTGDNCLIIEDVVTSGSSVMETTKSLTEAGLRVTDAIVLLDREQGGKHRLKDEGITLHSVCTVTELLSILQTSDKLSDDTVAQVKRFISENNTYQPSTHRDLQQQPKVYSYGERATTASHPVCQKLFSIMENKKSNLALSADVTSTNELLKLADSIGPYICVLKTHIDILKDFTSDVTSKLQLLAQKHNFLIFEDRKFADIGSTVKHQLTGGIYHINQWADLVNCHCIPGPGIIRGLKEASQEPEESRCHGCLLIAEMSSEGHLANGEYTKKVVAMAEDNQDFVMGFICQTKLSDYPGFVHMTPGVKLEQGRDGLGQQYLTPHKVITERGSDIIIVGRGILQTPDPAYTAKQYQEAGYAAYLARLL